MRRYIFYLLAFTVFLGCKSTLNYNLESVGSESSMLEGDSLIKELSNILVITPRGAENIQLIKALSDEVQGDMNVLVCYIDDTTTPDNFLEVLIKTSPVGLVLLDNSSVSLYVQFQKQHSNRRFPPAIIAMTVFLDLIIDEVKNATGITYEVPGVAGFTALRNVSDRQVRKIGLIYRETFRQIVLKQKKLALKEGFELIEESLNDSPSVTDVNLALNELKSQNIDALWLLNDIVLYANGILERAWMPFMRRAQFPAIASVDSFLQEDVSIGTLAILPDYGALGLQVASLLLLVLDSEGLVSPAEFPVELPVSVRTVVQKGHVGRRLLLSSEAEDYIDEWYSTN